MYRKYTACVKKSGYVLKKVKEKTKENNEN